MNQSQMKIKTLIGPLYLVASEKGLHGIFWEKQDAPMVSEKSGPEAVILKKTAIQLDEYFNKKRKEFDIPLVIEGTPFQKKVWKALTKIPYGETCAYKDIAKAIQNDKAVRAVGTANGRNSHAIIIPCHRVIAADNSIGGYGGGLKIKKILLSLEGYVL